MALATADGGATWTSQAMPPAVLIVASAACPSSGDCYAVRVLDTPGAPAAIVATVNGGETWTTQPVPVGVGGLYGVACPTTNDCSAAVGPGSSGLVLATDDGGTTWTAQVLPTNSPVVHMAATHDGQGC